MRFWLQRDVALLVALALPSASGAFVLANRLGSHCGFVAELVIVSNLPAMSGSPAPLTNLAVIR
jgi:hypothetical protein